MAQIIQIKRSTTPGNTPGPLQTGELAINVTDGSLFFGSATTVHNSFKFGALDITNDLTVVGEIYADMIKRESSNSNTTKIKSAANKWEIYAGNSSDEEMKIQSSGVSLRSNLEVSGTTNLRSDVNITGGDVSFVDNAQAIFGDGGDLSIVHNSVKSIITNTTGEILFENEATDEDIRFKGDDDGATITALTLDMSDAGTAIFNHDISLGNDGQALFGDSDDLKIYHSGSHSIIQDAGAGDLQLKGSTVRIRGTSVSEDCAVFTENAGVELYYDDAKKFETTTDGVSVSGSTRIKTILEIGSDTDKFLMSDSGNIKYVTGANLKSYIGAESGTVTSVGTTGTVNGITLTGGDITSSGTITLGGTLGSIANSQLTNSTINFGGVSLSLGGSDTTPAFNLSDATAYPGDSSLSTTGTITAGIWGSNRYFTQQAEECEYMGDYVRFGAELETVCGSVYAYDGTNWVLANATAADKYSIGLLAIAIGSAPGDGMLVRGMFGTLSHDPGGSGEPFYLSTTDGELTNTAPTASGAVVRVVGYGLNDTPGMWFCPDNTWVELS